METGLDQLLDLFKKGGFVMYPLAFLSLISWVLIIERLFRIRVSSFLPDNLKEIKILIQKSDLEGAKKLLALNSDPFSRALAIVIDEYIKGNRRKAELTSIMESQLASIIPAVEKNLLILSAIASIAPLLGLFGTITGLIKVFSAYASVQTEEALRLLSAGISEALTAAATGLIVAIPALLAYWIFRNLGNEVIGKIEDEAKEILNMLE